MKKGGHGIMETWKTINGENSERGNTTEKHNGGKTPNPDTWWLRPASHKGGERVRLSLSGQTGCIV